VVADGRSFDAEAVDGVGEGEKSDESERYNNETEERVRR